MEIATPIASTFIQDYLVSPTINQVRYLFCFNNIVEDLHEAEQQLQSAKTDVETDVQIAERNTEKIKEVVQAWLTRTSRILGEVQRLKQKIEANKSCLNGWCPNCGYRYWLGRKATKCTSIMVKLKNTGNFDGVGHRISPPGIEFSTPEGLEFFQSSKRAFDEIMEALKNDNIHTVILHGMGGAGKTTLAKSVLKKVTEEGIFNETMMAVVSQTPNFRNIQDRLAERLNLKWDQENTDEGRADRLFLRFSDPKSKFLVILDDIWDGFNFRDKLGIPVSKHCKLLLTTRYKNVCTVEEGQSLIPLNILKKDEGVALLKRQAVIGDDSDILNALANEVANECDGLPLALVTVGKFLRGKDNEEWEVVREKLKKSKLEEIHNVNTNERSVYASLKLSYDFLKSAKIRLCFLLCSLFPEDYEIPLEQLVRYGMGLDLFEYSDSIEAARRELRSVVKDLKALGLLLDTDKEEYVKMHDLIRDVALWIASKGENVFMSKTGMDSIEWSKVKGWDQYTAISSMYNKKEELPVGLVCPKLVFLLLHGNYFEEGKLTISDGFFKEMKELKVVTLSNVDLSLKSLQFLTHLQTLELLNCNLGDISSLTKLNRLEILSFRGSSFKELPRELSELRKLRVLDLRIRDQMKSIPSNVIQTFSQLEELYISDSFCKWEVEVTSVETGNARISELNSLSRLAVLFFRIDAKCLPKDFDPVWPKLLRYDIGINTCTLGWRENSLRIRDIEAASLIAFKTLYQTVEYLFLGEIKGCQNIIPSIDQGGLNKLKSLVVNDCESLEYMFITEKGDDDKREEISSTSDHETVVFRSLEELKLVKLPQLRCIWKGPTHHVNLQSLTTMKVSECRSLTYLFSLSIAQSLVQLESLKVEECESLEHLIMIEEGDNDKSAETVITEEGKDMSLINLPKLKKLNLSRLTNLIRFCPEFYISTWPALEKLTIVQCSNLSASYIAEIVDKVQKLRILTIGSCNHLYEIVVSRLKDGFFNNLENLCIKDYGVKVLFELEGLVIDAHQHMLSLPNLKILTLKYLQELEHLCKTPTQVLSLQNLTTLEMSNCNRLRNIFSPSLAQNLLQLQVLWIIDCAALEEIVVEDHEEDYSLLFQNLLDISVVKCPKLRQVFPITIAPCLQKLNYIELNDNSELVEVFGDKDVADVMDHKEIVLPQLGCLLLQKLPGLTNFCPVGYHFIFPSLSDVLVVKECPKMNTRLTLGQDNYVHAEAKALLIHKEDGSVELQPSLKIECYNAREIQESLPSYIEYDEQSITHQKDEDNMET